MPLPSFSFPAVFFLLSHPKTTQQPLQGCPHDQVILNRGLGDGGKSSAQTLLPSPSLPADPSSSRCHRR
ncbi:hypothetical protein ACFX2I_045955 [Malus domestica]